jgi:DNA-binding GntR family transcriptional regulator
MLPGTLLAAGQLAERFDVSRSPVQEALKALCQERLVRVLPRVGYVVTPVAIGDIDEIFDLRLCLEVLAAGRAAERTTDEQVSSLRVQHDVAVAHAAAGRWDDPAYIESVMAGNRDFHTTIAAMGGNGRLARVVGELLDEGQRIYFLYFRSERPPHPRDFHQAIIDALAARDAPAARDAMQAHILDMRDGTRLGSGLA